MKPTEPHPLHKTLSGAAIGGICVGTIVFLVSMTALVYKCYRRRVMVNAQNRLSTAIKKGLQESTSGSFRKSTPVRSTGKVMKSKATSPITPPSCGGELGGLDRVPLAGFSTPSRECGHGKSEVYIEHEKGGATPEKEELLKEKYPSEKATQLGSVEFSVEYDTTKQALIVSIANATNLPPRDPNLGGCDPYVKLQLLPEKKHKCKTRVLRKTLDPVYDETFTFFGIAANQFSGITLHFVVLSFDRFSRDDIIGEVIYPLSGVDPEGKQVNVIREISPRHLKLRSQGRGDILVSLCYQPAANRLGVVVLKARNLPKMDITGLSDPYIKIYLLYNGQRIAKKKTHVKKRTLNPVFNESFLFDVPYNEGLQNISLEFLVLDWDRMTKNEVVGRLEIGSKTGPTEVSHWNEVINCPRKQIAEWHKLRE